MEFRSGGPVPPREGEESSGALTPLPISELSPLARKEEALSDCIDAMTGALRGAQAIQARIDRWMVSVAAQLSELSVFRFQDVHGGINVVSEEIAMRLGISRIMSERYVAVGRAVEGHLEGLGSAMEAGLVGIDKAWAIVDALGATPREVALLVEDIVLPRAPERTPAELRRDVARALIEVDPLGADQRHQRATARRSVGRPRAEADGMASMRLVLPAQAAVTLDAALDACAAAVRRTGDSRTSSQLRADALTDWATGLLRDGWCWNAAADSSQGRAIASAGTPELTVPGAAMPELAGAGGVGAGQHGDSRARRDARSTALPSVRSSAQRAGRTSPRAPIRVGPVPAAIKVTIPLEVLAQALPGWVSPPTPMDALAADIAGAEPPHLTSRLEAPWLEGYGPIAPATARLLAAGGTWRRIVTDSLTGAPLDVGRERYVPPPQIVEAVRHRDPVCARPGCSIPSGRCELDHVVPWHQGGTTSLQNLAPLCPRCHRIKTLGGGKESHVSASGVRTWTSAAGTVHAAGPERSGRRWLTSDSEGAREGVCRDDDVVLGSDYLPRDGEGERGSADCGRPDGDGAPGIGDVPPADSDATEDHPPF